VLTHNAYFLLDLKGRGFPRKIDECTKMLEAEASDVQKTQRNYLRGNRWVVV
jgi:hypothetical protein